MVYRMTWRAVLIGFIAAMLIAMGGYFNDIYMRQSAIVGNFLPISIVGGLLVFVLVVSPLLWLIRRRWRFSAAELAVMLALPFAVCVVPSAGFMRSFGPILALSPHYESLTPSWQKNEVLSFVPDGLLVREQKDSDELLGPYLAGKGTETQHIGLRDVPWHGWLPALSRWLPLFLALMFALIGLSLVVHRQWSTHEHLVYPVAEFIKLVTGNGDAGGMDRAYPPIIRNRLFWGGLAPVLVVHIVNGIHQWFPRFIRIPHEINARPLQELFPTLASAHGGGSLFFSRIIFSFVAFAYFLPSDITLSLGLANLAGVLFSAALLTYGVSATYTWVGPGELQGMLFGAYLALTILTIYSGRAYYLRLLRSTFRTRTEHALDRSAVWGLRAFLLMSGLALVLMRRMGLGPMLSLLTLGLFVVTFLPMSRICAETGLFFIQPSWQAVAVLLGLFGAGALGPRMLTIVMLMCLVISIDPRAAMMPFITNALKVAENAKVRLGALALLMTLTLGIGLVAGTVTVLWQQYDRGVGLADRWASRSVPTMGFNLVDSEIQNLKADGRFEQAVTASGFLEKLRLVKPRKRFVTFALCGAALFAGCAVLRLRFAWWKLHPILFLVWFTMPVQRYSSSWFIGWIIKSLVVRFGGGETYHKLKPVMVGLIAGDLLGGLIFMVVGSVYYLVTGYPPERFMTFR